MEEDEQRNVHSTCENSVETGRGAPSTSAMKEDGRPEGTKVTELSMKSPQSTASDSEVFPLLGARPSLASQWWPFSRRATVLCGGGLLSGAGGFCTYILSRKPTYDSDRFLLYNPVPPGQRWSRLVDLLIHQASKIGCLKTPLLYIPEKGFDLLEFFLDHALLQLYSQAFSIVAIISPFAVIYGVRMAWDKVSGDSAPTNSRPPIAQFEVDVNSRPTGEHGAGASVAVSVSVDKGRLLRRLPSLLLSRTASNDSQAEEDQQLKPLDPFSTAAKPVFALVLAGCVSAPFLWLSTHLFFASVQFGWPHSDLFARIWYCHTGIVVAGMVALELGCGGLKRIFSPDSNYRSGSSSE